LKLNVTCLFLLFLSLNSFLFANGGADSNADAVTHNNEWVLCITEFNTLLSGDKTNITGIAARELKEKFSAISFHTRISPEYAYYEEYAWAKSRSAAAKSLAVKTEERSRLIFQGEPDWKYRQNIKRAENEIEKLRTALEEIDSNAPLINNEPVFKLASGNMDLVFPKAPDPGGEARFCASQKADAILFGAISDFHGRYFLSVRLFTLYNRAFVWEDSVIFSHDDLSGALDEIIKKLVIILSGNRPAALVIKSQPEETLLLVNRAFAGRGETELAEYPVGKITVTASALNYETISLETELKSGELTEINIKLNPVEYGEFEVSADTSGNLYHGALYIGKAPFTLRLPVNSFQYIEMSANNGNKGSIVFQTPDAQDYYHSMAVKTGKPLQKGRVEKERKIYYWAWGSQWITGIAAWIGNWTFESAYYAFAVSTGRSQADFINEKPELFYFRTGSIIAFGVASAFGIYQMIRYIVVSSRDETQLPKTGRKK